MIKTHHQDDQDALFKACGGVMSRFLDFDARVKSAASEVMPRSLLEQYRPPKGFFAQHLVAMGDTEIYGQNRNADGWSKDANTKYHPTFVSHGAYFREHNHANRRLAIGSVKCARYNPTMSRIELIVHGEISKCEDIYESIKKGSARSDSMSARVPNDRCNCCGNLAPSPTEYCDHAKNHMNQWMPEFNKYAFVWNDHPTFFDISDVKYPADRTAHYLQYMFHGDEGMKKAASAKPQIITGTDWAAFYGLNENTGGLQLGFEKQAQLQRMAEHETWLNDAFKHTDLRTLSGNPKLAYAYEMGSKLLDGELSDAELTTVRTLRPGTFFGELAKRASILPFRSFLAYTTNRSIVEVSNDPVVKSACSLLPDVFNRLLSDGCGCGGISPDLFEGSTPGVTGVDGGVTDPVEGLLDSAEKKFSIEEAPARRRILKITIIKSASELPQLQLLAAVPTELKSAAERMAGLYGLYKLAALSAIRTNHPKGIDAKQELAVAAHNNFCAQ
jgi:hypothetical protein